jgi:hypothetical protein
LSINQSNVFIISIAMVPEVGLASSLVIGMSFERIRITILQYFAPNKTT